MQILPTYRDVCDAATVLSGRVVRTPLIENAVLNEMTGGRVFLKPECIQRTGSFKFRGAFNAIHRFGNVEVENGVVACSSGNHAQGIAEAARLRGIKATILMPSDAPQSKKDRTRRSGAQIVEYDRHGQDREQLTKDLAENIGVPIVHPYEAFDVIAGQGTCGLEFCEDIKALGLDLDHVLVCTGGGGLLAGILLATQELFPNCKLHPVEPEGHDDQKRSHELGHRVANEGAIPSVSDAIVTPMPGEKSFAICKGKLGEGLVVSDDEALRAVAFAFRELKLVVEPGGGVTLAALLAGKIDVTDKVVVATLTGGNVDPDMFQRALAM